MQSRLVIGISSRALFNLNESHKIFEAEGVEAYRNHQIENENVVLEPGEAFNLVRKILKINELYDYQRIEVVLLSRNTADTGLRIFNSIEDHKLNITRAVFCGGQSPYRYVKSFGVGLFLSSDSSDVELAIKNRVPAARIVTNKTRQIADDNILKIAFDGDSVIFSDEAEKIFHKKGLHAFLESEKNNTNILSEGPFKSFLLELNKLQAELDEEDCPIRTALVTARSAPSHTRVIKTLRKWNVRVDESLFLGGMNKTDFLKSFGADIFFDDQILNIDEAQKDISSGHVIYGVKNQ